MRVTPSRETFLSRCVTRLNPPPTKAHRPMRHTLSTYVSRILRTRAIPARTNTVQRADTLNRIASCNEQHAFCINDSGRSRPYRPREHGTAHPRSIANARLESAMKHFSRRASELLHRPHLIPSDVRQHAQALTPHAHRSRFVVFISRIATSPEHN
jgi:hypothetical protein